MRNADKPISPCLMQRVGDDSYRAHKQGDPIQYTTSCEGLTKREYFAALALQGTLSNPSESDISGSFILKEIGAQKETAYDYMQHYPKYLALLAVKYADALLSELEKTKP